jgi:hypothetical protein
MATIFRGLNTSRLVNDIDNPQESLLNLGIDYRDLDAIRGISEVISANELKLLAGLVDDQRKEFVALAAASEEIAGKLESLQDFRNPYDYNLVINNRISGSAIKFNYQDQSKLPSLPTETFKSADISTSRISSWSSTESGKIFYGGELLVQGDKITLGSFRLTDAPVAKRFRAEVATHEISFFFKNGSGGTTTERKAFAMKGIPLSWQTFFKDADLTHKVSPTVQYLANGSTVSNTLQDNLGQIPPTWRVVNDDNGFAYDSGDGVIKSSLGFGSIAYNFRDPTSKSRVVEFYYPADRIEQLRMPSINLSEWPAVQLPGLNLLDISLNDFFEMPKFGVGTGNYGTVTDNIAIAPNLKTLTLTGNNMSRSLDSNGNVVTANVQLQYLPTTIETLTINGTFSDDEIIDLEFATNLKTLSFDTTYTRDNRRRMTGAIDRDPNNYPNPAPVPKNGTSPRVNSASILSYNVLQQPYSRLADGVCDSLSVSTVNLTQTPITQRETARKANGVDVAIQANAAPIQLGITIDSNSIVNFYSYSSPHNIINFNGKTSLSRYYHRYSRGIPRFNDTASAALPDTDYDDRHVIGGGRKTTANLKGCTNLVYPTFYATDVEDDIENAFKNLPNLRVFDVRYTRMYGRLASDSFSGSPRTYYFLMGGSYHGNAMNVGNTPATWTVEKDYLARDDFFSVNTGQADAGTVFQNTNLYYMYMYNNKSVGGDLPDFTGKTNFRVLYIYNCSFGSSIDRGPGPSAGEEVDGAPFPQFSSNFRLYYIQAGYNRFTGAVPPFNSTGLRYLFLYGNRFNLQLPELNCPGLYYYYLQNNQLPGFIPSFENCPAVQRIYLNNNDLTGYISGAVATNTQLRIMDFSNNALTRTDGINIINDLAANYTANPRAGVSVNLINQADSVNGLRETFIQQDPSAGANLNFLRAVGWSIQLTP